MDPDAVLMGHLYRDGVEKAAARLGVVDHVRFPAGESLTGQRYEHQLAVVLQQHLRTAATEPLHDVGDQGPDEVGREFVRAVEDFSEERFPEALGPVRAPSYPLTFRGHASGGGGPG